MNKLIKRGKDIPFNNPVLSQVGWLGATGKVYELDKPPYNIEKGSFSPIYIQTGEKSWFGLRRKINISRSGTRHPVLSKTK